VPSISTRASKLACVVAFAAVCLIGWVAKSALAQDPPVPALLQELPPKAEVSKPSVSPDQEPAPLQASSADSVFTKSPPPQAAAGVNELSAATPSAPDPADDPEKVALAFVEQNQKQAESQLKNLKDEETKLRARLQKVESGIRRWESLLVALKQSEPQVLAPGNADQKPPIVKK
jgi:hypothetical protein